MKDYDYSKDGAYFITVCVKDKHEMLGEVVGCDAHIAPPHTKCDAHIAPPHITYDAHIAPPHIKLSEYGHIVLKYIHAINVSYPDVRVDKYIIMPNHIHIIIALKDGAMWASLPTKTPIPTVIRSLKTLITKEIGFSLWQTSYHDHIIRDEAEYQKIWQYIDENPAKWAEDCYYAKKKQ